MDEVSHINRTLTDRQYLDDLRQRINEKAESLIGLKQVKVNNRDRIIIIVCTVFGLVLEAVSYHRFGWDGIRLDVFALVGVILLVTVLLTLLCIRIQRHHLTAMKGSRSVLQHYQSARRYKNTLQLTGVILLTGFMAMATTFYQAMPPTIDREDVRIVVFVSCLVFAILMVWRLFKPDLLINKDFYNDVEELGEHV